MIMNYQNNNEKIPKYCSSCGAEIEPLTRFCIICGHENPHYISEDNNTNGINNQTQNEKHYESETIGDKIVGVGEQIANFVDGVVNSVATSVDEALNKPKKKYSNYNVHEIPIKKKKKKPKPPLKSSDLFWEGIFSIIFGILAYYMPFPLINSFLGILMVNWIKIMSGLNILHGVIRIIQSIFGMRMIFAQQILIIANLILTLSYLDESLLIGPAIMGIPMINSLQTVSIIAYNILSIIFYFLPIIIIIGVVIDSIVTIRNVFTLRSKYKKYLIEYNDYKS